MRAALTLALLVLLALACVKARSDDEEPMPARVLCEHGQLAVIQIAVPEPGVYTLRIPRNVCGRSA